MEKIRRTLTNSRIDNMYFIYKTIREEFDKREVDEMDKQELFGIIVKKCRGTINPAIILEELDSI